MKSIFVLLLLCCFGSCAKVSEKISYVKHLNHKAQMINEYEKVALNLAKKNKELEIEISELKFEIQQLKTKNAYLAMQVEKGGKHEAPKEGHASETTHQEGRSIASMMPPENDVVEQKTYKWSPEQLLAMAKKEFEEKHYEKAVQYYQTLIGYYPDSKEVNEDTLFESGLCAFEIGKHEWALNSFQTLTKKYPESKFYRGAKLWSALTWLKQGKKKEFFEVVEEFRKKYRNTKEWTILSAHYETLMQKFKQ